ncbi:hypothetical protein Tco_0870279 [Tanacetum coccineum]
MGMWYSKDNGFDLKAFADADHASCQDLRKSTSGSAQFLDPIDAVSTDYGFDYNKIPLYYDSKSAIALSCNTVQHSTRNKLKMRLLNSTLSRLLISWRIYLLKHSHENALNFGQTPRHVEHYARRAKTSCRVRQGRRVTPFTTSCITSNMSRENPQATIVFEEQIVSHANRLVIKKNNQRVASDSDITDTKLRFIDGILRHHKLYKPVSLTVTVLIIYLHQHNRESDNEPDDANNSDMDLSDDNPNGDDDFARIGVFMYNKSTETPKPTYFSPIVISSSLDFIQNLLNETPANELTNFVSNPVYTDAQTTSAVKKNIRKINFKKEAAQKFREYDQKLEALTNFNVSKAFEKAIQARVLTEINKLLPTHIPKAVVNYLYDTLYESVCLDHDTLNAQEDEPSFYKRSHDNQDPPNNHEGENRKKKRKDVGEPSSRPSRRNKYYMVHAQNDTLAMQPLDQEDEYIQTRLNPEWYTKSGSAGATKKRTTCIDLLLKLDIDQIENHILGPSIVAIEKKLKALTQKDELTLADLEC